MNEPLERLRSLWTGLYDGAHGDKLEPFLNELETLKTEHTLPALPAEWYKDVVVYLALRRLIQREF